MKELIAQGPVDVLVGGCESPCRGARIHFPTQTPNSGGGWKTCTTQPTRLNATRLADVADELPQEAQEVLFVRGGKTVTGAWIGGIFWHSKVQQMALRSGCRAVAA